MTTMQVTISCTRGDDIGILARGEANGAGSPAREQSSTGEPNSM
jgi:hypothetical protein